MCASFYCLTHWFDESMGRMVFKLLHPSVCSTNLVLHSSILKSSEIIPDHIPTDSFLEPPCSMLMWLSRVLSPSLFSPTLLIFLLPLSFPFLSHSFSFLPLSLISLFILPLSFFSSLSLKVNGKDVGGMHAREVIALLRSCSNEVQRLVKRPAFGPSSSTNAYAQSTQVGL